MTISNRSRSSRSGFVLGLALALTMLAAPALFLLVQNVRTYIAVVNGQFYTPLAQPREPVTDRALSKPALGMLWFALWPAIIFTGAEAGAGYFVSRLIRFQGRHAVARGLLTGCGIALVFTCALLMPIWWFTQRSAAP